MTVSQNTIDCMPWKRTKLSFSMTKNIIPPTIGITYVIAASDSLPNGVCVAKLIHLFSCNLYSFSISFTVVVSLTLLSSLNFTSLGNLTA